MSATLTGGRRSSGGAPALAGRVVVRVYDLRWKILQPATGVAMMALLLGALLVAPREGDGRVVPVSLEGKYDFVPFEESDVSSTGVRHCVARNEPIDDLVPAAVVRLIREKGIYRG